MSSPIALTREKEGALPRAARVVAQPSWPRHILVASHGTKSADAAIVAARELADQNGSSVEIVVAYAPRIPVPESQEPPGVHRCERPERGEAARVLRTVHGQRRRLVCQPSSWPLYFDVGDPVSVTLRVAGAVGADLVMLGIGREDPAERRCGGRAPHFVVRHLQVPLYAAAVGCAPPVRCVIALPDGRVHAPTIRAALACMAPRGRVWLALPDPVSWPHDRIETGSARELVERVCDGEERDHVESLALDRMAISGDMLDGVLRLAEVVDAQLIAVPIHGMPGPVRSFLPNIAEPLLVAARCSVLVVPDEGHHETRAPVSVCPVSYAPAR